MNQSDKGVIDSYQKLVDTLLATIESLRETIERLGKPTFIGTTASGGGKSEIKEVR